jgi:hypothetical protein
MALHPDRMHPFYRMEPDCFRGHWVEEQIPGASVFGNQLDSENRLAHTSRPSIICKLDHVVSVPAMIFLESVPIPRILNRSGTDGALFTCSHLVTDVIGSGLIVVFSFLAVVLQLAETTLNVMWTLCCGFVWRWLASLCPELAT